MMIVDAVGTTLGIFVEVVGAQEIRVKGMMNMNNKNVFNIDFIDAFSIELRPVIPGMKSSKIYV